MYRGIHLKNVCSYGVSTFLQRIQDNYLQINKKIVCFILNNHALIKHQDAVMHVLKCVFKIHCCNQGLLTFISKEYNITIVWYPGFIFFYHTYISYYIFFVFMSCRTLQYSIISIYIVECSILNLQILSIIYYLHLYIIFKIWIIIIVLIL